MSRPSLGEPVLSARLTSLGAGKSGGRGEGGGGGFHFHKEARQPGKVLALGLALLAFLVVLLLFGHDGVVHDGQQHDADVALH